MAQSTYHCDTEEDEAEMPALFSNVTLFFAALGLVGMFFGGRQYEGTAAPFTHQDVVDTISKCGEGEFLGGCVDCKKCEVYEFNNGGCSFFKDSFCSYCEPVFNCQRENLQCSTREDMICLQCDCTDFIVNWTDVEVTRFIADEMYLRPEYDAIATGELPQEHATYSCYWNDDCRPCTVCEEGSFEAARCSQSADTECEECSDCKEDQWVSAKCLYHSDTECTDCSHCLGAFVDDTFTETACVRYGDTGPLFKGSDAVCAPCQQCAWDEGGEPTAVGNEYTSSDCTEFSNSECSPCSACDATRNDASVGGQYIDTYCEPGDTGVYGRDIVCADCTDYQEGFYETALCEPLSTTDAVWTTCSYCTEGQWEHTPCQLSSDAICPQCYPINHCAAEATMCSNGVSEEDNDSVCIGSAADAADPPGFACQKDFYGETCGYWRTYADCGVGHGYRERTARSSQFAGTTSREFIAHCMMLCDEFPDCLAFEIDDGGTTWAAAGTAGEEADSTRPQSLTKPNSLCSLKHLPTGETSKFETFDLTKDCFSNIRRQREDDLRTLLSATPAPLANLDLVYAGVGAIPIIEGDWKTAATGSALDMGQRTPSGEPESQLTRAAAWDAALERRR